MAEKDNATVTLLAGGDIGPVYEPTEQFAELISPVLRQADLRLGQCERTYSERGWAPQFAYGPSGQHTRLHPRMASVWKAAGIDIVSLASNHTMDWGPEPALDTVELFRGMGKHVIGAGRDAEEARKPAIVERNGVTIAFLSYCSVLRDGQAAGQGKAGVAPVRAHTYYAPEEFQPGTPPRIITVPYEEDVRALHGMYHFPSHCRKAMLAKAVISKKGMERVSFLPMFINHRAQPYVVAPDDPKFQEILEFTEWVSDQHPHKFRIEDNEVVVDTSL